MALLTIAALVAGAWAGCGPRGGEHGRRGLSQLDETRVSAGSDRALGGLAGLQRGEEAAARREQQERRYGELVARRWRDLAALLAAALPADAGAVASAGPGPAAPATAAVIAGRLMHYGESYSGGPLGCGVGVYDPADPTIVAVGPARYSEWPCGTRFRISGPGGSIVGVRVDACPGCGANHLDVSEAAAAAICGYVGNCEVTIEVLE